MQLLLRVLLIGVAMACAGVSYAQTWPQKPIRLVVPFTAGGTGDILARFLGQRIGAELGQPVVIENKAGAGGTVGAGEIARSAADGTNFLFSSTGALVIYPVLSPSMPYNPDKDLRPVAHFITTPMVILVSSKGPDLTLADLVRRAKANPGKLNYASAGNGTTTHLGAELLNRETGITVTHVPYRGSAPAITDLMAGVVDFAVMDAPVAVAYVKSGHLRPLALTWPVRSSALPNVPTTAELGFKGIESTTWYGVLAPAKTPDDIVNRMNAVINKVLQQSDTQAFLREKGVEAAGGSPADFGTLLRAESAKWSVLAREVGAKLD